MREIVVISGKGGTGKTSLTACLAHLATDHVICDLDVDAPDLHLVLGPKNWKEEEFRSGHEAQIDQELCTACGDCAERCVFGAIGEEDGVFTVDPTGCEGCKLCVHFCPAQAIAFNERHAGDWYMANTRFGPLVHARLFPGNENSGRLVALLKEEARKLAERESRPLIVCDGAPGIGCAVISSLSGAGLALIVTEPTPSGLHDLARVAELAAHFKVSAAVVINKWDINEEKAAEVEVYCRSHGIPVLGRLPFDPVVNQAVSQGRAVTELDSGPISDEIGRIWARALELSQEIETAKAV